MQQLVESQFSQKYDRIQPLYEMFDTKNFIVRQKLALRRLLASAPSDEAVCEWYERESSSMMVAAESGETETRATSSTVRETDTDAYYCDHDLVVPADEHSLSTRELIVYAICLLLLLLVGQ